MNSLSAEAQEIVAFFGSGSQILEAKPNSEAGFVVIRDLSQAKKNAWEEVYGDDELTWADIRSKRMSAIWREVYKNENHRKMSEELERNIGEVDVAIRKNLGAAFRDLLDDVCADFRGCLYCRAFAVTGEMFFEDIFRAYRSGGWPCGWSGPYPGGSVLVFMPD